jgi:hypothetical protein
LEELEQDATCVSMYTFLDDCSDENNEEEDGFVDDR